MLEGNPVPCWTPVGDWDGDESTSASLLLPLLSWPPLLLWLPLLLSALPWGLATALALLGRLVLLGATSAESLATPGSSNCLTLASTSAGVLISGSGSIGVGGDLPRARAGGLGGSTI